MKTHSHRVVASLAVLAMAVTPATALASTHHTNSSARKAAEKFCRAQDKRLGKAKFDKKYGPKNAFGKCVSTYEKTHKK